VGVFINFCAGTNEQILPAAKVDALLVNPLQHVANEVALARTQHMIATAGATFVMMDSGGFQFYSMEMAGGRIGFDPYKPLICRQPIEINLAPSHVVTAAVKLRPTVMTGLDWPINKLKGQFERDAEFMKKFGFNIKWIQEMVDLRARLCPDVLLFLPLQFYDLSQFHFYEVYLNELTYDGLSMPTRNLDSAAIILLLMKFHSMGVSRVHLLGINTLSSIAIACFFARHFFDWCSLDACTWRMAGQFGDYLAPNTLKRKIFDPTKNFNLDSICSCPWCSYRTYFDFLNTPITDQTYFLRCHNYHVITKAGEDCWEHSTSTRDLGRCLTARVGIHDRDINELIQSLNMIEIWRGGNINVLKDLLNVKL
jgi:queuine/archaeosine tRNA-ribosyltransferase